MVHDESKMKKSHQSQSSCVISTFVGVHMALKSAASCRLTGAFACCYLPFGLLPTVDVTRSVPWILASTCSDKSDFAVNYSLILASYWPILALVLYLPISLKTFRNCVTIT